MASSPSLALTIAELAATRPDDVALEFPGDEAALTFAGLVDTAARWAALLRTRGVRQGDLVGLVLPNDSRFVPVMLGAWWAGAAAAPMPVQGGFANEEAYAAHILALADDGGIRHIVIDPALLSGSGLAAETEAGVTWIDAPLDGPPAVNGGRATIDPPPDALAVVQYTSGSTSAPKGVELTHANLVAGLSAYATATGFDSASGWGVWMPLFHDFGIISVLTALSAGGRACVWTPRAFLRHPSRWLADFASRRLTHYSGPNFSFDAMADAYDPAAMEAVDLSAWRVAVNGAEAVSVRTIRRFLERFGPHGYRPSTMVPAYGMAEATLVATVSPLDRDPRAIFVDRAALAGEGRAVPVAGTAEGSRALVSVGPCVPGMHLRVVGGDGRQVDDGQVGEIQLSGDSVSDGYFRRDWRRGSGWLATGDLGIVVAGELYVVGRSKDVIIVRGVKYHPEDIEPIVADLREARGRRCGVVAHGETDESIAVVLETRLSGAELQQLRQDIRATLVRRLGISRIEVLLVEPRTIPVTSSGKIRRRELHDRLEAGLLHDLEESPATTAAPASR